MTSIKEKISTRKIEKSILIVEPDNNTRIFYADLLMDKGYNVLSCAKNGKESINKFKKFAKKPEIIIIESKIAQKNEFQVIKKIAEIDENAKFIIFNAEKWFKEKLSAYGNINILKKSFTINELIFEIEFLYNI